MPPALVPIDLADFGKAPRHREIERPSEFADVRPLRRSRDHPGISGERPWPRHQEENGRHR